jgi:hypothetical protein
VTPDIAATAWEFVVTPGSSKSSALFDYNEAFDFAIRQEINGHVHAGNAAANDDHGGAVMFVIANRHFRPWAST